jgi:uncharacterized protein (DUF58 family)
MRPTPRAVLLVGAGLPLVAALISLDGALWPMAVIYFGLAGILIGADGLLCPGRGAIEASVRCPGVLFIGDPDPVTIEVALRPGCAPTTLEALCDVGQDLRPTEVARAPLRPAAPSTLAIALAPARRGRGAVERVWLRTVGPLGLAAKVSVEPVDAIVPIIPNIRAVRHAALRFSSPDSVFGAKPQRQQGDGSDFDSLRDYVAGLDPRSIDWKRSARHMKPVCKEFRTERNHHVVLALDTGRLMGEPIGGISRLDHGINAGLLLAYFALKSGDRVGLFAFDSAVRHYVAPAGGTQHFLPLNVSCSALAYGTEEANYTLGLLELTKRLTRRSLVILMTDFVDTITAELMIESLARTAKRHLVLFVTLQDPLLHATRSRAPGSLSDVARAVVSDELLRERQVVLDRLKRIGAYCIEAPRERLGIELLNQYLVIKRLELV